MPMRETRLTVRRRLERQALPPLETQVGRITRLLQSARREVLDMPTDTALRRRVCADLDAIVQRLRGPSVQADVPRKD